MRRLTLGTTWWEGAGLVGILITAAVLRFWNLPQTGIIFWDGAKFALEGERMRAALLDVLGRPAVLDSGKAVGTAKPTHALLIGLAMLLWGTAAWVPLSVSAASSVISVGLTYLVGRRLFDIRVGLLAAAFLAVSEYELIYARSTLSESDGSMVLLAGIIIWLGQPASRTGWRRTVFAGLALGVAFTTNYRLLIYIGTVVLLDLLRARRSGGRVAIRRLALWGIGLALPIVAWQTAGLLAEAHGLYLFRNEFTGRATTYVGEALYQLHGGKQAVVRVAPLPYLQWIWLREGPLVVVFLVAGAVAALRHRSAAWGISWTLILLPAAAFTFAPFIVPRNLEAALPALSILAAAGLLDAARAIRRTPLRRTVLAVAVVVSLAFGAGLSWRLTQMRSGFATAARYLRQHGSTRVLTTTEIMVFYLPDRSGCAVRALPVRLNLLARAVRDGYTYAVIDRHSTDVSRYIASHAPPVAVYFGYGDLNLGENLISSENADPADATEPPDRVAIYNLASLRLPGSVKPDGQLRPCSRDTVA